MVLAQGAQDPYLAYYFLDEDGLSATTSQSTYSGTYILLAVVSCL